MRLLLLLIWFLFMASATLWLPAYRGEINREVVFFALLYAFLVVLVAVGVRRRVESVREALLSAFPNVVVLAAAAVAGLLLNSQGAEYRGEPLFLFFGVALWASWTVLVLATALASRTKWNSLAGSGVGFLVAVLGMYLFTLRVD
jgi:hypothetical protein